LNSFREQIAPQKKNKTSSNNRLKPKEAVDKRGEIVDEAIEKECSSLANNTSFDD
jgi:hypothetical protein